MQIFKYKPFSRWAKGLRLNDVVLAKAIDELENGLYDAI